MTETTNGTEAAVKDYDNVSIIIPAYNEEDGIVATLETLREYFPAAEIIVVDDGSKDATADRVTNFDGVRLIQHDFNRGYGGALKTGMRSSTRQLIAWFDADNEHRADFLQEMINRVQDENLAAVLGQRPKSVSIVRGVGKYFIRMLAPTIESQVRNGPQLRPAGLQARNDNAVSANTPRYLQCEFDFHYYSGGAELSLRISPHRDQSTHWQQQSCPV